MSIVCIVCELYMTCPVLVFVWVVHHPDHVVFSPLVTVAQAQLVARPFLATGPRREHGKLRFSWQDGIEVHQDLQAGLNGLKCLVQS